MSKSTKRVRLPSYRLHKQSGQAIVTLSDGLGNRRDVLLGKHDAPESKAEYERVILEWLANAGRPPRIDGPADITVNELIVAYWQHAVEYYGFERRGRTGMEECLKAALRILKELYGDTPAREFGPLALKACRQCMIEKDWSRLYINRQVQRLCRLFKFAVAEELLPEIVADRNGNQRHVYLALKAVEGLRRGQAGSRETHEVRPVPQEHIDVSLPKMPSVIQAMVQFQLMVGCRPTEVCIVRPIDIDMRNAACWIFTPQFHKTEHHGHERKILIGPRAQEVLRPWLGTKVDGHCFSPAESEMRRNAIKKASRQTPMTPSQAQRRPKKNRKRPHRDHYDATSYRNAIWRACDKAKCPRWSPNRLRHNRATELRCHGLDVTKTILGHTKVETTQIYAEKDMAAAMALVSKIG